jgi:uncharacterized repeat protein (TIGR03803 family)
LRMVAAVGAKLHSSVCSLPKCADGWFGSGDLLIDGSGSLFGTYESGGKQRYNCCGVAFRLVPNGAQFEYSVVYNFCSKKNCRDGVSPQAGLISDQSGNLFGTTSDGGSHYIGGIGGGTVFELSGSTLTTLYDFCAKHECRDGENPAGPLIMDANGNLFGTTQNGGEAEQGGTVFELSP